jgi:hypothetical protein
MKTFVHTRKVQVSLVTLLSFMAIGVGAIAAYADTPQWDDQFGRNATGVPGLGYLQDLVIYNGAPHAIGRELWDGIDELFRWDGTSWIGVPLPNEMRFMREMCVMDGAIYMGANCGGVCVQVAKWDGSNFSVVGVANTSVHAVGTDGTNLYVSGRFTEIDGVPARRIAKWDGAAWSEVGGGVDDYVGNLYIDGSNVYASGWFDEAGGSPIHSFAMWNGAAWDSLGGFPASYGGSPITKYNGDIYTRVMEDSLGRWNGSTWEIFPVLGNVTAFGTFDGHLYVALQKSTDYYMLKWDGTGVPDEYYEFDGYILALRPVVDRLFVGGTFDFVGAWEITGIAEWFGDSFRANGCKDVVEDIAVGPDGVYAGGQFLHAGTAPTNYVGRWDGFNWHPLGGGVSGTVNAVCSDGANVYVGGTFLSADTLTVNRVARWDGSVWHALGGGVSGIVYDVATDGSDLYAGGSFLNADGAPANRIARWDGSSWHPLGDGVSAAVRAIVIEGSDVYAGGDFFQAGGTTVKRIARWDGSHWHELGGGLGGGVFDLAMHGGDLYVAGNFATAGGVTVNRLAVWNGSTWTDVGGGFSGNVYSIAFVGNELYVGGEFSKATPGGTASYVAMWDGVEWAPLDTGTDGRVSTLCVAPEGLYAGGMFTTAGPGLSEHFGLWTVQGPTSIASTTPSTQLELLQNTPNPFNPSTTITYTLHEPGVVTLAVYDVSGRLVRTLVNNEYRQAGERSVLWYGRDNRGRRVASGVYFYRLKVGREAISRKMVLVE